MAGMRTGLLREIVGMAFDTLRTSKMRSALTVLGVVIGITSIVGMTSLIRGFDNSLRDSISQLGPDTIMVQKWGALSFAAGRSFLEVARRPNLTMEDARAIERECPSVALVDVWLGVYGNSRSRIFYGRERTKQLTVFGATENWAAVNFAKVEAGRLFIPAEVEHRRAVVLLGNGPWQSLFPNVDPIGKTVRIGSNQFTVIGVLGKRPSPGNFSTEVDDFAVIPYGTHEKFYGKVLRGSARISASSFNPAVFRTAMIAVVPRGRHARSGLARSRSADARPPPPQARRWQRLRPGDAGCRAAGLGTDQPRDVPRARRHPSIALMVGGIGVMAIMMISVTERTREIGVRKALGARRREILWQFLIEAAFLTSVGGLIGIIFGSGIGLVVHWASGFPVSLPWWSFAIGIGFSASVGIFFGLFPAIKASRLDPIEALRYE